MTERMIFRTVQGFKNTSTEDINAIKAQRAAMLTVMNSLVIKPLAREVMLTVVDLHNRLQTMTGVGEQITNTPDFPSHIMEIVKNEYFDGELAFVLGAVNDPFLYSDDSDPETEGFQQGAVLNLRKAQLLLRNRYEDMTA